MSTLNKKTNAVDYILSLPAINIATDPMVKQKFINIYMKIHGVNESTAELFYETESYHFNKKLRTTKDLQDCERMSIYGAFIDIAVNGLSIDPSRKLAYLQPGGTNIFETKIEDGKPVKSKVWINQLNNVISPYGELSLRQSMGQIKYVDNVIIVYQGDVFDPYVNRDGFKMVDYKCATPRKSNIIVGSFIKITRPDGSFDYFYMLKEDIERLKKYSANKFGGTANALYGGNDGQIDSGFLQAKTIKHAFKAFPPVLIKGTYSKMEDLEEGPGEEEDLYGLPGAIPVTDPIQSNAPAQTTPPVQQNAPVQTEDFHQPTVDDAAQPSASQPKDSDEIF